MKKNMILILLMFGVLLAGCSDDSSYTVDEVIIDASIHDDGSVMVRELFTYTFSEDSNRLKRSVAAEEQDFQAYEATDVTDVTDSTDDLKSLNTAYDSSDEVYKTDPASKKQTQRVLYTYELNDEVEKYQDIGAMLYEFSDETSGSDLHEVSITIHPPSEQMSDDMDAFLHDTELENLQETNDGVHYETEILEKGDHASIRFIFPSDELPEQTLTEEVDKKEELLALENELQEQYAKLNQGMSRIKPIIWAAFPIVIILWIIYMVKHPSVRYGGGDPDEARALLESSDPLFVKYLFKNEAGFTHMIPDESLIAALFSLRRRGIITIEKIAKEGNQSDPPEETFRFTWVDRHAEVDAADDHLRDWLFMEFDQAGTHFNLKAITHQQEDDAKEKREKKLWFDDGLKRWKELLLERESYQNMKKPYRHYPQFLVLLTIITYSLFIYFNEIDTLSYESRWITSFVLGAIAVLTVFLKWKRTISAIFHVLTFIALWGGFTMTHATVWALVFIGFMMFMILMTPPHYWIKPIREMKSAINKAENMFREGTYPVSEDPEINEMRLEYAMLLNKGKQYSKKLAEIDMPENKARYPLLSDPTFAEQTLAPRQVDLSTHMGDKGETDIFHNPVEQ